jgi:hypothetical protein
MKFKIYPKKAADTEPLELEFDGFEIQGSLLRPRIHGEASVWGFINLKHVAAVIPELSEIPQHPNTFDVYVRGRQEPLTIHAQAIKFSEDELSFCSLNINLGIGGSMAKRIPLRNVYVNMSEVVAVVPKEGSTGFKSPNVPFD